jgi:uncharacterized membrane protein
MHFRALTKIKDPTVLHAVVVAFSPKMYGLHWSQAIILGNKMRRRNEEKRCLTVYGAMLTTIFSLGAVNAIPLPVFASSSESRPEKVGDTVQSSQEVQDHKVFQVDKVRIEAPKECVWAILTNYPDAPRVYPKVTICKVLVDEGANKIVAFKVKAFKDMVTLDYSLNIKERFPSSIEWSRHDGAFKANEGYWHINPVDDGKSCVVTYAKFVDAGGFQQFFVTKELKADMPMILASVKTSAETFYQNILHEKPKSDIHLRSASATSRSPLNSNSERITETTTITLKSAVGTGI